MRTCRRGEIYYADLSPVIGSEQGGSRPVLIVQNDIGNKYAPTVIVAPITSKVGYKTKIPTHVVLNNIPWLESNSIVLVEQIRTIDKCRLDNCKGYIGNMNAVDKAIGISLGVKIQKKQKIEELSNV